MSEFDSEEILETVRKRVDDIFGLMDRLDPSIVEYYHDSPNFRWVGHFEAMDGPAILFYDGFCNAVKGHYASLKSVESERWHEHYNILSSTVVLYNMTGKITSATKDDDVSEITLACTMVFQLIDGEWKVILENESGLPKKSEQ